ncbi:MULTISPECIES: Lpp/OprI family alanine-zipper lipoprotein [Zooshikella]|uniref:Major outer membrane lipoprotein Lpp n=1 Tax=Zooshikella harenae TaxID=2827238 RepID=A0ABS5ZGY1_9GAMM|nr:Lpp/OprI family alanine-zipper lipoprotein [Zooshikella harenae]MBU2713128.1 hypothetical protein [Zooshikella harenae]
MTAKLVKLGVVAAALTIMAGCATNSRVDALEQDINEVKDRLSRVEQTAASADAKADQIMEKLDRMSGHQYMK